MAHAQKIQALDPSVVLIMDSVEAGYLKELLYAHVGGKLTMPGQPLYRVLMALDDAHVQSKPVRNLNSEAPEGQRMPYASLYAANDPEVDERKWWS